MCLMLRNIVLQGDTWGSLLASVQVDSIAKECHDAGYGYLYKGVLPISMLGLVDDTIGVTEAGYKAQQMNAYFNVKTAEKGLRFGPSKCKSMLIGKDTKNVLNTNLSVDSWTVKHEENLKTGERDLTEIYDGQILIEETDTQNI